MPTSRSPSLRAQEEAPVFAGLRVHQSHGLPRHEQFMAHATARHGVGRALGLRVQRLESDTGCPSQDVSLLFWETGQTLSHRSSDTNTRR